MGTITPKLVTHDGVKRIALYFDYEQSLIDDVRMIKTCRWSKRLGAWHVKDTDYLRHMFGINRVEEDECNAINVYGSLPDISRNQIKKCIDWMRSKRYSESTIESYKKALLLFFEFYNTKSLSDITNDDVVSFNVNYILERKLSATYQSQFINALKLFYALVNDKKIELEKLVRPAKPFKLPKVLSEDEVAIIINAAPNLKHKSMLSLIYSAGLRRGEVLNLTHDDVDSKRMLLLIRNAKGMKDRVVPLSPIILGLLRD